MLLGTSRNIVKGELCVCSNGEILEFHVLENKLFYVRGGRIEYWMQWCKWIVGSTTCRNQQSNFQSAGVLCCKALGWVALHWEEKQCKRNLRQRPPPTSRRWLKWPAAAGLLNFTVQSILGQQRGAERRGTGCKLSVLYLLKDQYLTLTLVEA